MAESGDRSPMERTSVTLPLSLIQLLKGEANATGVPVSAIVRQAILAFFSGRGDPPLPQFTGAGASGVSTTSQQAEEILSGRFRQTNPKADS